MKPKNLWNCTSTILSITSIVIIFSVSCRSRYCIITKNNNEINDSLKMEKAIEMTIKNVTSPQNVKLYSQY